MDWETAHRVMTGCLLVVGAAFLFFVGSVLWSIYTIVDAKRRAEEIEDEGD